MSVTDLPRFDMVHPESLEDLCSLIHDERDRPGGVAMLAGGTDLMVEIVQKGSRSGPLPLVVDISRMASLRGIRFDAGRLRIGGATTYLEIERSGLVQQHAPLLCRMGQDVGGPTIQARGTLGGNLATSSPAADGVAAIAAYDPVIVLRSVRGERQVPLAELQTGYKQSSRAVDEVIVAVECDTPPLGSPWIWRKVGTRLAQAISKVAIGGVAVVEEGRITRFGLALASVAPVTCLMSATRAYVLENGLSAVSTAGLDAAVERDVAPIDDIRSTRDYRVHCSRAVVRAFLRQLGASV